MDFRSQSNDSFGKPRLSSASGDRDAALVGDGGRRAELELVRRRAVRGEHELQRVRHLFDPTGWRPSRPDSSSRSISAEIRNFVSKFLKTTVRRFDNLVELKNAKN